MERLIVDRIEEGKAVCENSQGEMVVVENPPVGCKEGDCLELVDNTYVINSQATADRTDKIQSMFHRLKKKL